jgi:putative ABC transport system permease protein
LANQAAYWEHRFLANQVNFIAQGYRIIPQAIFLQAIIALLIPQLAGIFPILHGTRISIQEALSGAGNPGDSQNRAFNWLVHVRGLSRPLLISIRNTFRRRLRLALTLLTLVLGRSSSAPSTCASLTIIAGCALLADVTRLSPSLPIQEVE